MDIVGFILANFDYFLGFKVFSGVFLEW